MRLSVLSARAEERSHLHLLVKLGEPKHVRFPCHLASHFKLLP
jgi:hypothetical protein